MRWGGGGGGIEFRTIELGKSPFFPNYCSKWVET